MKPKLSEFELDECTDIGKSLTLSLIAMHIPLDCAMSIYEGDIERYRAAFEKELKGLSEEERQATVHIRLNAYVFFLKVLANVSQFLYEEAGEGWEEIIDEIFPEVKRMYS